jgi:hypothetical protein
MILAAYGELPDHDAIGLERHLAVCDGCRDELEAIKKMDEFAMLYPMADPDPNLLAQSRMRLDEALDAIPQRGFTTRLRASAMAWFGHITGAPALATLLVGVGFLGGNFTYRYQVAHTPIKRPMMTIQDQTGGGVSTISAIKELPGDLVQVSYNRVVPEMAEGTLDDPQIRQLLMMGTKAATTNVVRVDSVALLAAECKIGHECRIESDGTGIRGALLTSLRTDKSPGVRLKALEGLQPYVTQDDKVRDAVLQSLLTDSSSSVRQRAITMLQPVQSDTSVRQVLRTVSTTDENPYLRTVSAEALAGSASLQ